MHSVLKRWNWWLISALLMVVSGCELFAAKDSSTGPSLVGQELELVVPREFGLPAAWELWLEEWKRQTGVTVRWNEVESTTTHSLPAASTSRLQLCKWADLAELGAEGQIQPISSEAPAELPWSDYFLGLRTRILERDRQPAIVPVATPVLVLGVRDDLLQQANLRPPTTWDEYQLLLETLKDWAPGLVAVEPCSAEFRATLFAARSLSLVKHPDELSVWFDVETGDPLIKSPGFIEALTIAQKAWRLMPAEIATMSPADCRHALLSGRAAMAIWYEPAGPGLPIGQETIDPVTRPETARFQILPLPGSRKVFHRSQNKWEKPTNAQVNAPTLIGFDGWVWVTQTSVTAGTSAGPKTQDRAAKEIAPDPTAAIRSFLAAASDSHLEQAFSGARKTNHRETQVATSLQWCDRAWTADEAGQLTDAAASGLRQQHLALDLSVIGRQKFQQALSRELQAALAGTATAEAALERTQHEWEGIVKELGTKAIRDSYRTSVGLRPKK